MTGHAAPPPSADDARRAAELRSMKRGATGLLVVAALVFVLMRATGDGTGWRGFAEAGAEAAMVGALADWFAVTALFRHPLGLPIPHTAIIARRKDQIGRSLGTFVQDNFLHDDLLAERLHDLRPSQRIGTWLTKPENTRRLGNQTASAIEGITGVLRDDEVAAGIESLVVRRVEEFAVAPVAARAIDIAIDGGHLQQLLDATLRGLDRLVVDNREMLRQRLRDESPWWVPEAIDDRVFVKLANGLQKLIADILADPHHEVRAHVDERVRSLAAELRESPALAARVEAMKMDLLDHPDVRDWVQSLWTHGKAALLTAAENPDSELRARVEGIIAEAGASLAGDAALQAKVDGWLESLVRHVANQSQDEVADLISSTVARWDADQTSRRLELQVGRDLQFIRINGTIVGGLAGLAIHTVAVLV